MGLGRLQEDTAPAGVAVAAPAAIPGPWPGRAKGRRCPREVRVSFCSRRRRGPAGNLRGTETLRGHKMQHLSPWSRLSAACGASPTGKHCPDPHQPQTPPQLPAPSRSRAAAASLPRCPRPNLRWHEHRPISPSSSSCCSKSSQSACPEAVTQPCSIQTCNPGSLNAGVWHLSPFSVIFRQ